MQGAGRAAGPPARSAGDTGEARMFRRSRNGHPAAARIRMAQRLRGRGRLPGQKLLQQGAYLLRLEQLR